MRQDAPGRSAVFWARETDVLHDHLAAMSVELLGRSDTRLRLRSEIAKTNSKTIQGTILRLRQIADVLIEEQIGPDLSALRLESHDRAGG
jgi:hypothetical protein